MKKALNEACRLGNNTACDDLKNIKKVHEHDFGLLISVLKKTTIFVNSG